MKPLVVRVIVEGDTEADFVKENIAPLFRSENIVFSCNLLGGIPRSDAGWAKISREILRTIKNDTSAWCTTFIDLYALPSMVPGIKDKKICPIEWVENIENEIKFFVGKEIPEYVEQGKFFPHVQPYEFETLLFSKPECISSNIDAEDETEKLLDIRKGFKSPEHINNNYETSPSHRLKKIFKEAYQKPLYGNLIVNEIGIDVIRKECRHFNDWLKKLEKLKNK